MLKLTIVSVALLINLLAYQTVFADKILNMDNSTISFVSIKKGTAGEAHKFKKIEGILTDKGELTLMVDLGSVDTKIALRDERMQKTLFETDTHLKMLLTAQVESNVAEGEMKQLSTVATLDLHGVKEKSRLRYW